MDDKQRPHNFCARLVKMAGTIYATMRKYDQNLHKFARSERAKAEKQAEIIAQNKGDPNQTLRILGIRSSVHHDVEQYNAIEAKEGLIPWNDEDDNLIDRFDGRALLDFYREPPKNRAPQQKTDEEEELEEQLCFESFRDLVVLLQSCEDDEAGLQKVEKGEMEEGARQSYEKSTHAKVAKKASATGAFAAVGFSYGGEANPPPPEKDGSSDEDEDNASSSSESSESDVGNEKYEGVNKTAEDLFGLEDFSGLLKRERREKKNAKAVLKKPNPMGSRRQRRKKIRELRSQGITDRDAYKQFKPQQPPPSGNPPPEPSYRYVGAFLVLLRASILEQERLYFTLSSRPSAVSCVCPFAEYCPPPDGARARHTTPSNGGSAPRRRLG